MIDRVLAYKNIAACYIYIKNAFQNSLNSSEWGASSCCLKAENHLHVINAWFSSSLLFMYFSDAQVFVESQGQDMQIVGLDSQGYLKVKSADGALCSLQPDGNSFDMMRNLIYIKS